MWVHQILALPFPNSDRTSDKQLPGPQLPHLNNGPINRMALGFKETVHLKYLLLCLVYSKDLAHVGYYRYCILLSCTCFCLLTEEQWTYTLFPSSSIPFPPREWKQLDYALIIYPDVPFLRNVRSTFWFIVQWFMVLFLFSHYPLHWKHKHTIKKQEGCKLQPPKSRAGRFPSRRTRLVSDLNSSPADAGSGSEAKHTEIQLGGRTADVTSGRAAGGWQFVLL